VRTGYETSNVDGEIDRVLKSLFNDDKKDENEDEE
jgi:hypothetical protein